MRRRVAHPASLIALVILSAATVHLTASPLPPEAWTHEALLAHINQMPEVLRPPLLKIANDKDQARVARVALESPDGQHRLIATHTLTDQKLLAKVAGESNDQFVRWAAAGRLNGDDTPSLVKLAETSTDVRVRGRALQSIKDEAIKAKLIAAGPPGDAAKPGAVAAARAKPLEGADAAKILDPATPGRQGVIEHAVHVEALVQVAIEEQNIQIAEAAAKRLVFLRQIKKPGADERAFERVARDAKTLYPRRIAIGQLTDAKALGALAADKDAEIRGAVAAQTADPALLGKLTKDESASVRAIAIGKVKDAALLQRLAASDPEASVRRAAQQRLDAIKAGKK